MKNLQDIPLMSDQINELVEALCKAQEEIDYAVKDKKGYGYKYADLAGVIGAVKPALNKHGIAISFLGDRINGDDVEACFLLHKSGQWMQSRRYYIAEPQKGMNIFQAIGSCITYARRYLLAGMTNVPLEDDDGVSSAPISGKNNKSNSIPSKPTNTAIHQSKDKVQNALDRLLAAKEMTDFDSAIKFLGSIEKASFIQKNMDKGMKFSIYSKLIGLLDKQFTPVAIKKILSLALTQKEFDLINELLKVASGYNNIPEEDKIKLDKENMDFRKTLHLG